MNPFNLIVTGSGPEIGKTIVSAILTTWFSGSYWKPIECGHESDTETMCTLLDPDKHRIYSPSYKLKAPLSPHHAAGLEKKNIEPHLIKMPSATTPLIIETAGGILVPLQYNYLAIELFESWKAHWIIVSKHYLGSINHTLLLVEALKKRHLPILGLVFNGEHLKETEEAILVNTQLPMLGRLLPEPVINKTTIQKYAKIWHPSLKKHTHN